MARQQGRRMLQPAAVLIRLSTLADRTYLIYQAFPDWGKRCQKHSCRNVWATHSSSETTISSPRRLHIFQNVVIIYIDALIPRAATATRYAHYDEEPTKPRP
eukprot:scaffold212_cov404-Prasinococcus_capsulatus_cf.AAC.13